MDEPAVEQLRVSPVVSTTIKAPIILRVRALHGSDVDVHRELGPGAWVSSDILGKTALNCGFSVGQAWL